MKTVIYFNGLLVDTFEREIIEQDGKHFAKSLTGGSDSEVIVNHSTQKWEMIYHGDNSSTMIPGEPWDRNYDGSVRSYNVPF